MVRTLIPSVMLALCLAGSSVAAAGAERPNIVLCMADDQGWGDVGYNGHPVLKTPHMDAAAAAGLRFDRFYAAAPVCTPTRASVLTGRHPNRFGAFQWGHSLRPQEGTLAEALAGAGYVTGHFGKWHVGSVQAGSPVNPGASGFHTWVSTPNYFDNDPVLSRNGVAEAFTGESSIVTSKAALEFIRAQAETPEPFLAVVWFGSPHLPHEAAKRYRERYSDQPEKKQHFYGEITAMDEAFGMLREELRALGIHENTVLWYCSDNGALPDVGRPGGRGHKGAVYEGGLRVPAFIEWPERLPEPRVTDLPCTTSDIYPTVLASAGVALEHQPPLDGVNLLPLLDATVRERPKPIGFWDYPADGRPIRAGEWMKALAAAQKAGQTYSTLPRLLLDAPEVAVPKDMGRFPGHAAWLDWPWKLHRIAKAGNDAPRFALYNLEADPEEQDDRAAAKPERAAEMKKALSAWQAGVVESLSGSDYH